MHDSRSLDFSATDMHRVFKPMGPVEVPYVWNDEESDRQYVLTLHYPQSDPEDFDVERFNLSVDSAMEGETGDFCWDWHRDEVEAAFHAWLGGHWARWESLREKVKEYLI